MLKKTTLRKRQDSIWQMLTLLLLVFYIAVTSSLQILHVFAHDHEQAVTHSPEQEKDPCHRLLYHHDDAQSCDHDSHLVASDTCDMCDLAYHGDQALLNTFILRTARLKQEYFSHHKVNLDSYWAVISSSRAPPALI